MNWQPIETAPKDGERILAYRWGYAESMTVVWWSSTFREWTAVQAHEFVGATHWMPLPEPPTTDKED